jgi:hypothetical protein
MEAPIGSVTVVNIRCFFVIARHPCCRHQPKAQSGVDDSGKILLAEIMLFLPNIRLSIS